MASMKIPSSHVDVLRDVGLLHEDVFEGLAKALDAVSAAASNNEFADALHLALTYWPTARLLTLISAITSLHITADRLESDAASVVDEVAETLANGDERLRRDGIHDTLSERLGRLLRSSGLAAKAEALLLKEDVDKEFLDAKLITDIRPIFTNLPVDGESSVAQHAIVMHTLRIGFWSSGGGAEAAYYVLDDSHLRVLLDTVNEALARSDAANSLLGIAGVKRVLIEEPE
jgi:hypothetical protein